MTALSRNIARKGQTAAGVLIACLGLLPVAASTRIFQDGAIAVNTSGYLVPASADPSLRVVGLAPQEADNRTGSAGDLSVKPRRGAFYFANSSTTDAVTDADVGRSCFVVDDNTVARTSALGVRPVMGRVLFVDSDGVLVEVGVDDTQTDLDIMVLAGADLSAKQFHYVDLNSSGAAVAVSTAGARIVGILQNAPASGAVAVVRPLGCGRTSRLLSGGSVTAGDTLGSTAAGRAKTAVTGRTVTNDADAANDPLVGSFAGGIALSTGASDGDPITVLLSALGVAPQTAA